MTSSLVGLGDVYKRQSQGGAICWNPAAPTPFTAVCTRWSVQAITAVSYTHLTLPTICSV
eukprot:2307456-Prorocentrum_lima.AAC.1